MEEIKDLKKQKGDNDKIPTELRKRNWQTTRLDRARGRHNLVADLKAKQTIREQNNYKKQIKRGSKINKMSTYLKVQLLLRP